ncbi:hypothetical protein EJ06DRAFT_481948 [Trichodelitschia bisporula]|uniref:EF-hand domain-containing protein n=1 Tax=Trichodelitschia bisporula TaxID=703511 RepID=A0A6G1HNF2_9PEZI|nr:hypothetical protein EJ06DRAFT_481948 [Trichodelitschia bisporula]
MASSSDPQPTGSQHSKHGIARSEARSSDEEVTVVGEPPIIITQPGRHRTNSHLTVQTDMDYDDEVRDLGYSYTREHSNRLGDDLAMLEIERKISQEESKSSMSRARSTARSRGRKEEPVDDFDIATERIHEQTAKFKPPDNPTTKTGKVFKRIHNSSFLVRWVAYITPVTLILLIPLLLGALLFKEVSVGGVRLVWFCIWLEIVWLSLWAGRLLAKCLPFPIGLVSGLFANNSKKWRDMGKQLELPATLFFWWLAIEISFIPTMTNHHINGDNSQRDWEKTMNKVLISLFVGVILNFVKRIIIQLIAVGFHVRTYQDRIELNKFQIGSLVKLYKFSKEKIAMEDDEFDTPETAGSGARTPGRLVRDAQENTIKGMKKFGDIAGKIAGDFTGRQVVSSRHPHQVVLTLLSSTQGSQILARRLYRTFVEGGAETVSPDQLKNAFDSEDEADAAFSMFDKDMNGDISMEELEAVCVEIGRERKSITASLKDLDSVISKLDSVFSFICVVITILVLVCVLSASAAGVLTSAGSAILALSWLFSATAQEFLQSVVFVFIKHPFDVGDRVTIYGNTGALGKGDDYFVKEVSLLYTEFKKMEGHVVQAPNSYLNTLFILNQRRSGGLAEAVPMVFKFGTTLEQIEQLRARLLNFVQNEKREYQGKILTELKNVEEAHSITLNIVFFYKSNWQNELLRLQRRNKFICALMVTIQELGIEGPRMRFPGQKDSFPLYMQNVPYMPPPVGTNAHGHFGTPDNPNGISLPVPPPDPIVSPRSNPIHPIEEEDAVPEEPLAPRSSLRRRNPRPRGESLTEMSRRMDFSLGMRDLVSGDYPGDVHDDPAAREKLPLKFAAEREQREREMRERGSVDRVRSSIESLGRSTSVSNRLGLHHVGTDSSLGRSRSSRRNRFFGSSRTRDEGDLAERGMGDIAEDVRERLERQGSKIWRNRGSMDGKQMRGALLGRSESQERMSDVRTSEGKPSGEYEMKRL